MIRQMADTVKLNRGFLWPESMMIDKSIAYDKADLVSIVFRGKKVVGIKRDKCHGEPIGTFDLGASDHLVVQKVHSIESSRDSAATWSTLQSKMELSVQKRQMKEGESGATSSSHAVVAKKSKRDTEEDSVYWTAIITGGGGGGDAPDTNIHFFRRREEEEEETEEE